MTEQDVVAQVEPAWVKKLEEKIHQQYFPVVAKKELAGDKKRPLPLAYPTGAFWGYILAAITFAREGKFDSTKEATFSWVRALRRDDFVNTIKGHVNRLLDSGGYVETVSFFCGFAEGLQKPPMDVFFKPRAQTDTWLVYIVMYIGKDRIKKLRSVTELKWFLLRFLPANYVGELKRLEKMCQRINLSFGPPGRRRKQTIQTNPK